MPRETSSHRGLVLGVFVTVAALGVVGAALLRAQQLPDGPVAIAWDREACAHCRMHVSDRAYAAQLQTTDGQIRNFDDPGCLLSYAAAHPDGIHATWFRHSSEDRWIAAEKAAFAEVPAEATPMGYGLAAKDASSAPISYAEALARAARRDLDGGRR